MQIKDVWNNNINPIDKGCKRRINNNLDIIIIGVIKNKISENSLYKNINFGY